MGSTDWEPQATAGSRTEQLNQNRPSQTPEELQEESRKIRRFQMVMNMVTQVIAQDPTVTVEQASEMVADTRRVALSMFPDKELAFNMNFWQRLHHLMR